MQVLWTKQQKQGGWSWGKKRHGIPGKSGSKNYLKNNSDNLSEGSETPKGPEVREVRLLREMVEVPETFTKSVTRFSNAYHNEEAKIDSAKPSSKTLVEMKLAYNTFITCYKEKRNADEFFKGKNRSVHLKIFKKLQDNQFPV